MKLTTSLIIHDKKLSNDFEPAIFQLDGNEDELHWKLTRQLAAVIAKHEYPKDLYAFEVRIRELMGRWNMPKSPFST